MAARRKESRLQVSYRFRQQIRASLTSVLVVFLRGPLFLQTAMMFEWRTQPSLTKFKSIILRASFPVVFVLRGPEQVLLISQRSSSPSHSVLKALSGAVMAFLRANPVVGVLGRTHFLLQSACGGCVSL